MGNFCCENKNIDEGNLRSDKLMPNSSNRKINQIQNQNSLPNLLEIEQTNDNNLENNFYEPYNINNDINNDNIQSNPKNKIIIPENIINSTKKLKLIIFQSKYLPEGKEYIINAGGLIGSKRNQKDGITFFGDTSVRILLLYKQIYLFIQSNNKNDFEFPGDETKTGQSCAEIKYDIFSNQYQIKSLKGSGCFIKVDNKIVSKKYIYIY